MVGFDPEKNPKRYDFDNALAGDRNAGVIDEQMSGAIMPGMTIPEWYGPATSAAPEARQGGWANSWRRRRARLPGRRLGRPEGTQERGGRGVPFEYEGPMINQINRSIETTHRLTGMPIEEIVVRGLIKKEIPMYGIAAALAMGRSARRYDYHPEERM